MLDLGGCSGFVRGILQISGGEVFARVRLTCIRRISRNENYSGTFAIILILAR